MILRSITTILISCFAAVAAQKDDLTPRQIMERYFAAYKTLQFSEVAPYVQPQVMTEYRKTTWAVIKHATERFGEDAIVAFFQGTTLPQLEAASDANYWAFVMASSVQFSTEHPIMAAAPLGELKDGENRILLVYPIRGSLATAPELGLFASTIVVPFQRDNGIWRMACYSASFEDSLYWYLRQSSAKG